MATPLYKSLKTNGTTLYVFPSAADHFAYQYQNANYQMTFNKFVLLNIPTRNLVSGTANQPINQDFTVFDTAAPSSPTNYGDALVESLRNYVANQEETIRSSKLNTNDFFYDNTALATPTERVFYKWCRKIGILSLEPASPNDEYFNNLVEFERNDLNDDSYFPEYLWRERDVTPIPTNIFSSVNFGTFSNVLQIQYIGTTNYRSGDIVQISDLQLAGLTALNGLNLNVIGTIPAGLTQGQSVIFDYNFIGSTTVDTNGFTTLQYNQLVQYIGEVTSINNVAEANEYYTEVLVNVPEQNGRTPDILFRVKADENYSPNLQYPILPSEFQPEIKGAENFNSPILNNPQQYPGSYFGQFDNASFQYLNENGDSLRRSGDYYGVKGDINNITFEGDLIDGITIDFDPDHYVKMNIQDTPITNFDQFSSLYVNNQAPEDFEYNAILWYYELRDSNGNTETNLYGISFIDNPQNNKNPNLVNLKVPTLDKLVAKDNQNGTSYIHSIRLQSFSNNEGLTQQFNPNSVYSLFSFQLYNEAMKRLAAANNSFNTILTTQQDLDERVRQLTNLIYTQSDLQLINRKIANLEQLLTLYQTLQLNSSSSIEVVLNNSFTPPRVELNSIDPIYNQIDNVFTTNLYDANGNIVAFQPNIPVNKSFLVRVLNNDSQSIQLLNNNKLTIVLTRDLDFRQSVDIIVEGISNATENKKLDILIQYDDSFNSVLTPVLTDIDLPVYFNNVTNTNNNAFNQTQQIFDVVFNDVNNPILFNIGDTLRIPMQATFGFNQGDAIKLNNFSIGSTFGVTISSDYSGQYIVSSVGTVSSYIDLDITSNLDLFQYYSTKSLPYTIHQFGSYSELNSVPYINYNQGVKYTITRVTNNPSDSIDIRYSINKENLEL